MGRPELPPAVARIVEGFEHLAPRDLPRLGELYTDDALFKDPFNDVQGLPAIRRVFEHMFATLEAPRFEVHDVIVEGAQVFLSWDFRFAMRRWDRRAQCIHGATHLQLAADGRIARHRDYWDAAQELYEKMPLLGVLMRWLRRQAAA